MTLKSISPARSSREVILSNTSILSAYYILESGILFVLTLLLARYLGVKEFGRLSFALSYGLVLSVLSDPGISLTLTKFVARDPNPLNSWIREGVSLRIWMATGTLALGLLPVVWSDYLKANALLLTAIVLSEQIRGLTLTYCGLFRAFQVMVLEAISLGVERIPLLAVVYVLLRQGSSAEVIGIAFLGVRLLSFVVAISLFRLRLGPVRLVTRPQSAKTLVREAFPLGVLVFAERINMYFVPLVLALTAGEYAVGLFQSAFKVATFPILVSGVVGVSLYPVMSASFRQHERTSKLYRYGLRALWHALMPCAVLTLLFAPHVIGILYGPKYQASAPLLQILTPYYLLAGLITVSYYLMPSIDQQKVAMRLSIASVALNLAVGIPMMYWQGARGAALSLLFTSTVIAAGYWQRASRLGYHVLRARGDAYQWAVFISTLILFALLQNGITVESWLGLLLLATAILAVYGTLSLATQSLLPEEWQVLASLKSWLWR